MRIVLGRIHYAYLVCFLVMQEQEQPEGARSLFYFPVNGSISILRWHPTTFFQGVFAQLDPEKIVMNCTFVERYLCCAHICVFLQYTAKVVFNHNIILEKIMA